MNETLQCKLCRTRWVVSTEDPDSTLSDVLDHLRRRHPEADPFHSVAAAA